MEKILTIVVPTYNAEKYLRDNLDSFFIPNILSDIEVLIINDGSSDRSLEIANEYVSRCPGTYRIISKENGGHGSGINTGIQHASGKYFKVVDADDWVIGDALTNLVHTLKNTNSDLVYSGFLWAYDHGEENITQFKTKPEIKTPFPGVVYGQEYRFDEIADKLYIKMHNITIKTAILREHKIRLDEKCFYVDSEYIAYPIPYVNTIYFLSDYVYMYRIGRQGQSVGIDRMKRNKRDYDRVISSLLRFYARLGNEIPCCEEKKLYLAKLIARIVAGKFKIQLCLPLTHENRYELQTFDENLCELYPDIYRNNINPAITVLRMTKFKLYVPLGRLVQYYYRNS